MDEKIARLQALYGASLDGFLAFAGGVPVYLNPAARQFLGEGGPDALAPDAALPALLASAGAVAELPGGRFLVSVSEFPDAEIQMICLSPADGRASDPDLERLWASLRDSLATQRLAADNLFRQDAGAAETREMYRAMFYHNYYRALRSLDALTELIALEQGRLSIQPAELELRGFCEKLLGTVGALLGRRGPRLRLEAPRERLWVMGDAARLEQLLLQLLSNSLRFTPEDGQVRLELVCSGDTVILSVVDSGCGISPERLSVLFGREQPNALAAGPGNGLGLRLARALAELHGGSLLLESAPGKGCQARLRLPLLRKEAPEAPNRLRSPDIPYQAGGLERYLTALSTALTWRSYTDKFLD